MYYVLWFIGIIAACMLAVVTGLLVENSSNEKVTNNK